MKLNDAINPARGRGHVAVAVFKVRPPP